MRGYIGAGWKNKRGLKTDIEGERKFWMFIKVNLVVFEKWFGDNSKDILFYFLYLEYIFFVRLYWFMLGFIDVVGWNDRIMFVFN